MPLDGQKVILTGGSGGMGALIATNLLAAKADLVVVDRVAPSGPARFIKGDLSTIDGISEVGHQIASEWPDILINLAGAQYFGPFEQQPADHVRMTYMVNLLAPVLLSQAVVPGMKQRQLGHIVNIGSILGSINYPYFVTYSSAKAGLHGLSQGLRRELDDSGIDITHIAPRAVRTGFNSEAVMRFAAITKMNMDQPDAVARRIVDAILKRKKNVYIGLPESFFVRLNAIAPGLVDGGICAGFSRARNAFLKNEREEAVPYQKNEAIGH